MVRSQKQYPKKVAGIDGSKQAGVAAGTPSLAAAALPAASSVQPTVACTVALPKGRLRADFINALKVNNLKERTIQAYCNAVSMFQGFLHHDPLEVSVNDIRAFFFM